MAGKKWSWERRALAQDYPLGFSAMGEGYANPGRFRGNAASRGRRLVGEELEKRKAELEAQHNGGSDGTD